MPIALLIIIFLVSAAGVFMFAGWEAAMLAVNRKTLEEKLRDQAKAASDVFRLISEAQHQLAATPVGMNACTLAGGLALFLLARRIMIEWTPLDFVTVTALILTVGLAAPVYLLISDVLARPLARWRAAEFLVMTRWPLRLSLALTEPLLYVCAAAAGWLLRPFGIDKAVTKRRMTAGQISAMLGESQQKGSLRFSEREMIEGAIDLQTSKAREIMRPLVDVIALKIPEATVETALETARRHGYSRYPVFRNRILEMTEYVSVREILRQGVAHGPIMPYVKPALIVPETMRIDVLLRAFLDQKEYSAVVVDEFGGAVGWVTREDILEEIVGDIADKRADEEPGWTRDEAGVYHVAARMDLDDLNWQIGSHLRKGDDYDTLGGWIYTRVGRVPHEGESMEADDATVTVEKMDGHRILLAAVKIAAADAPPNA
ncbi:MAG: hemolysin family protein [Candidatus Sumerlaeota bacterium]|nr:hemolysin family protein [Candidatus Sumerlaeota bacterium]